MTELVFFVGVPVLFLSLLLVWILSQRQPPLSQVSPRQLYELSERFDLALPCRQMATRIFAKEDWNFICETRSKKLRKLLVEERRSIALYWIKVTRQQVTKLLVLYRLAVRMSKQTRPASEVRLLASYTTFLLACHILYGLVWVWGPFKAKRAIDTTLNGADRLVSGVADFLAGLEASCIDSIWHAWERRPA